MLYYFYLRGNQDLPKLEKDKLYDVTFICDI